MIFNSFICHDLLLIDNIPEKANLHVTNILSILVIFSNVTVTKLAVTFRTVTLPVRGKKADHRIPMSVYTVLSLKLTLALLYLFNHYYSLTS